MELYPWAYDTVQLVLHKAHGWGTLTKLQGATQIPPCPSPPGMAMASEFTLHILSILPFRREKHIFFQVELKYLWLIGRVGKSKMKLDELLEQYDRPMNERKVTLIQLFKFSIFLIP